MLLGFIEKGKTANEITPVFLPSHLTCRLGPSAYEALLGREVEGLKAERRDETVMEIVQAEGKDILKAIEEVLKSPHSICCVKLQNPDDESRIAEAFPDETIFIYAEKLPPFDCRPISTPGAFGKSANDCFDDFVSDVTGYRPKKIEASKKEAYQSHLNERIEHPLPEPLETPKQGHYSIEKGPETAQNEPKTKKKSKQKEKAEAASKEEREAGGETPLANWTMDDLKRILKRDLLNLMFAVVFLLLTFATSIGFFFLATDSKPFFKVMCGIMIFIFPILSAIPIGFIYVDNGRRLRPMPLPLFAWLSIHIELSLLCALIVLALGNGNEWDIGKVTLHFFALLSPILWAGIRIAIDPLLRRHKTGKK